MRATVTCVCCRRQGPHESRGLRVACYRRHHQAGTLERFPRTTHPTEGRRKPTSSTSEITLRRVARLDAGGYSPRYIGRQLNLSMWQVRQPLAQIREGAR